MTFESYPNAPYLENATFEPFPSTTNPVNTTFESFPRVTNPVNATGGFLDDAAAMNSTFEVYRSEDKLFLATSPIVGLLGLLAFSSNALVLLVLKNK